MRGYPKGPLSKVDLVNLLSMPEHADQAKKDLAKLADIDDRKIRIYESQVTTPDGKPVVDDEGRPVEAKYTEIDNPNPAWKRAGFKTITELTTAAIAVDIEVEPVPVPGAVDTTRPKPGQASTRKLR
jgi:hypothetical protein